jgi:hypothetical protein
MEEMEYRASTKLRFAEGTAHQQRVAPLFDAHGQLRDKFKSERPVAPWATSRGPT